MITMDWLGNIERDGFSILPDVADENLVHKLIGKLNLAAETSSSVRQRHQETYAIRNLLDVPAVRALADSAPIRALVEPVLSKSPS